MNEILKKRIEKGSKEYVPAPTKGELIVEKRIREDAVRACAAWGMEDGNGYGVKDTFQLGFVQGGFYALSHQWISVEEAVPEYDTLVLVKHTPICSVPYEQNNMSFARREARSYGDVWIINRQTWRVNLNNRIDNTVTHWMPIPKFELNKPE